MATIGADPARLTATTLPRQLSPAPDTAPDRGRVPWVAAARLATPAVGLYLAARAVSLAVMYALYRRSHTNLWIDDGTVPTFRRHITHFTDLLLAWDARWYTAIASRGYGPPHAITAAGVSVDPEYAFFPLYPGTVRVASWLPGLDVDHAALVVAVISSAVAAWGIFAIGNLLRGRSFGTVLVVLWAVAPICFAESGGFSESLFTALAAWALYAVLRHRWVLAGALTLVAGLCRPTAPALIGTVGLAAVIAIVRRRDGWRPYVGALLAPLGWLGYVVWAGYAYSGTATGYFRLQHALFRTRYDFGRHTWNMLSAVLSGRSGLDRQVGLLTGLVIIVTVVLVVLLAIQRPPWVLSAYAALILAEVLGTDGDFTAIPRHATLPTFPLLIPLAAVLTTRVGSRRGRLAVAFTLGVAAVLSGWYGGWLPLRSGLVA
jgi:hypothetical protein